jgi:hypothetical protein
MVISFGLKLKLLIATLQTPGLPGDVSGGGEVVGLMLGLPQPAINREISSNPIIIVIAFIGATSLRILIGFGNIL